MARIDNARHMVYSYGAYSVIRANDWVIRAKKAS
jgi:hypothetical protein